MKFLTKPLIALALLLFTTNAYAELAKEGSGSYHGVKSTALKIMIFERGHIQVNFDEVGVIVEAPEDSPFFNASFHVLGTFTSNQGVTEGSGGIKFIRPNGDTIYGTFNFGGEYQHGQTYGIIEILNGTRECRGMQGQIELLPRHKVTTTSGVGTYQIFTEGDMNWTLQ